ncbi:DNA-directed RNA polymerase III subunit RPC6 [Nematocida major]|uniref:DNA-directed RNA polymerase III subunit RPC6 n=1 Tax=Nematocida major TaxID=1912982 RepID=UPI002007E240|nr:DNA-directed RNA polymerase III subunit RPC6 [Nematocida major]KAH9386826.1 DNA-directed RNA polymerase III subunit RPC6 [Nematocida major]
MRSVLEFISSKESGVGTQEIQDEFKEMSLQEIVAEINRLHADSLIDLFRTKSGIFYRRNTEPQTFSSTEEKIVYLLVKESGVEGIWIKDIRMKSGLHQNLVTKLLKTLEQRVLIKSVKSIKQNRKVYMLYDAVPSEDLGDGPWFTQDAELDTGFVDAIKTVIYEWVLSITASEGLPPFETLPELSDAHSFLMRAGISSVPLTQDDVKRILDILVYERKLLRLSQKYTIRKGAAGYSSEECVL